MLKHRNLIIVVFSVIASLIITCGYIYTNYESRSEKIELIELHINKTYLETLPIIYLIDKNDVEFDLSKPFRANFHKDLPKQYRVENLADSILVFNLEGQKGVRKIRLYFEKEIESLIIEKITIRTSNGSSDTDLNSLIAGNNLQVLNKEKNKFTVKVNSSNGYLEMPKFYLYPSDKFAIIFIFLSVLLVLIPLFLLLKRLDFIGKIVFPSIANLSVILFIVSIFLPHPIFNLTLILSMVLVIKEFSIKDFLANKVNLIFIGLFGILFLNDLFVAEEGYHNLKATEKYLPFLVLPIYLTCVKDKKYLVYFPVQAILFGIGLFLTSLINSAIFVNLDYFSFNEFSKFTHPVYYSYLVSFSIFYIILKTDLSKKIKIILQLLLFFFLVLAGSKLVITITMIMYAILFMKNRKVILSLLLALILFAFFPPVQNRFKEIINLNDLSIIGEKKILNKDDPRVNGLTLRLLLWQESVNLVGTTQQYIMGLGVGDATSRMLKDKLNQRGLEKYNRFSTHNQFINIFMRTGLLGVGFLLLLIGYGFYRARKNKDKLLLVTIVMFTFAMLTESVLQRVLGVYFFTTVLLILMKPEYLNEDCDNRD